MDDAHADQYSHPSLPFIQVFRGFIGEVDAVSVEEVTLDEEQGRTNQSEGEVIEAIGHE